MVTFRKHFARDFHINALLNSTVKTNFVGYLIGAVFALAGFAIANIYASFGLRYRSLAFIVAVMLSAQIVSFRAALITSFLSILFMGFFFTEPTNGSSFVTEMIGLAVFLTVCLVISSIINRLKRLSREAIAQKHWLSLTLGIIPDAVVTTNKYGRIQFMNQAAEEMTGWYSDEAKGRSLHDMVVVKKNRAKDKKDGLQVTLYTRNHSQINAEMHRTYLKAADGLTVGNVYILRDGSMKKKMYEYENLVTAIVESSADAIIGKDANGIVTSWNKAAQKLYGYTAKDMVGNPISLLNPNKKEDFQNIMSKLRKGQKIVEYETVRIRKDGTLLDVSLTISPMKDTDGKFVGASTIARDISGRKRAELENKRELELQTFLSTASQQLFSAMDTDKAVNQVAEFAVPNIADWAQVVLLEDGQLKVKAISHVNKDKTEMLKRLSEEYPPTMDEPGGVGDVVRTGKSLFFPDITEKMVRDRAKDNQAYELLKSLELNSAMIVPLKKGKESYGAIVFIATKDSGRHFTKSDLYYAEELARRVAIAIQNAQLYASAQKAVQLRDEFFSIASHELKTPITSIKAFVQIMQKNFENKDDIVAKRLLDRTNNQVNKLILLVQDLLDITRIQAGKLILNRKMQSLGELVREVVADYQTTTPTHQIILNNLKDVSLKFDKERIEQVLTNFLSNAVKYSPNNDKVVVNMDETEKEVIVSVEDFGVGVPKENIARVFERFFRSRPKELGSMSSLGLGLYIAAEIMSRHGGRIWAESEEGKGSKFYFALKKGL